MEDDEGNDDNSSPQQTRVEDGGSIQRTITIKGPSSRSGGGGVSVGASGLPIRTNCQTVLLTSVASALPGSAAGANSSSSSSNSVTKNNSAAGGQQTVAQAIAVSQSGGGVSIVQLLPSQTTSNVVQSVIQPANHQSVIQATGGVSLPKNVILVNKVGQGSVIQSTESSEGGDVQTIQLISSRGDDNETIINIEDESRKRREVLARRPSYRKILNELSSADIITSLQQQQQQLQQQGDGVKSESDSDPQETTTISLGGQYLKVLPASQLQLATGSQDGTLQGIQTLTMTNAGGTGASGGTIVQYATQGQDGQFFVPVSAYSNGSHFAPSPVTVSAADLQAYQIRTSGSGNASLPQGVVMAPSGNMGSHGHMVVPEEQSKKRELRLLKNREAAKECRRKKKEYIKCLENRVAVLENQNKALIEELKSLKELYCQKSD